MANFLVIGSVTKDRIVMPREGAQASSVETETTPEETFEASGGKPYYTGVTLANLGNQVKLITKYAEPDEGLFQELRNPNIGLKVYDSSETTFFENKYLDPELKQRVSRSRSDGFIFDGSRISQEIGNEKFDVVFFGAQTFYEIPTGVLKLFKGKALTAADLEHFLHSSEEGREFTANEKQMVEILSLLDVVALSEKEAVYFKDYGTPEEIVRTISSYGPKIVILTMGERGCLIYDAAGSRTLHIPAVKVAKVVDTTGAGDVFMGAFLSEYMRTKDLQTSAEFASNIVAEKISYKGAYTRIKAD